MRLAMIFFSWLIVAFGQSSWIPLFCPFAALIGYALFWRSALSSPKPALFAFLWFTGVQAVQISWMSQTEYMGPLIWVVYLSLSAAIGLQFALLTHLVAKVRPLSLLGCAALAGAWVLLEWIRILPCTGFLWNPAGLSLSASSLSLQMASLFGIFGLSFWVFFTNLTALRALSLRTKKAAVIWILAALFPFAFGALHRAGEKPSEKTLSVLLVQPFLLPDERDQFPEHPERWMSPFAQWDRILNLVERVEKKTDLIVLPESAVPFPAYAALYPLDLVERIWSKHFGEGASLRDFPKIGEKSSKRVKGEWRASNAFWMQALANHYGSEIIAGMEDGEEELRFNAAIHFKPGKSQSSRYEKRILVPIGEYVPLRKWGAISEWIGEQFGIFDSFEPGTEAKLFFGRVPMGISICMEETYSGLIRESCSRGAELLVNLSNDGWFPHSTLASQHFDHGVIRAVENGVPLLRACCTGVTGGVDCYGRILAVSPTDKADGLFLTVPLAKAKTAYSLWGDSAILVLSGLLILGFAATRSGRSLLEIKRVD